MSRALTRHDKQRLCSSYCAHVWAREFWVALLPACLSVCLRVTPPPCLLQPRASLQPQGQQFKGSRRGNKKSTRGEIKESVELFFNWISQIDNSAKQQKGTHVKDAKILLLLISSPTYRMGKLWCFDSSVTRKGLCKQCQGGEVIWVMLNCCYQGSQDQTLVRWGQWYQTLMAIVDTTTRVELIIITIVIIIVIMVRYWGLL